MATLYPITIDNTSYATSAIDDSIYVVPVNKDGYFITPQQAWIAEENENYEGIASAIKEMEEGNEDMGVEVVFENLHINAGIYINYAAFLSENEVLQRDPLAVVGESGDTFFQIVPFSETLRFVSMLESFLGGDMEENGTYDLFGDTTVKAASGDLFVSSGEIGTPLSKVGARYVLNRLKLEMR